MRILWIDKCHLEKERNTEIGSLVTATKKGKFLFEGSNERYAKDVSLNYQFRRAKFENRIMGKNQQVEKNLQPIKWEDMNSEIWKLTTTETSLLWKTLKKL